MLFRLCLALGYPHPDYLTETLTSTQLTEWLAYYKLQAAHRGKSPPKKIQDFLPGRERPPATPDKIAQAMRALGARLNRGDHQ